ncbi:hypothetical protein WN944_003296 [Citrus x changshan-huyou]|uniref:Uncharacterized protein n=1 Tax=Citrus x changshan-huyou TaxID=2935761 RepID=A0AAP0LY83_9ROSI
MSSDSNLNKDKSWLDSLRLVLMQTIFLVEILSRFSIFMVFSFLEALLMEDLRNLAHGCDPRDDVTKMIEVDYASEYVKNLLVVLFKSPS